MAECLGHCYCREYEVNTKPHLACCNCGHQKLKPPHFADPLLNALMNTPIPRPQPVWRYDPITGQRL